ncbi:MAG: V-type ATP synthase subunit F [Candidatus Peregrinibacteria bacterium]
MAENYSIAIVGNKDTVLGFKGLGLKTFDANTTAEALPILFDLKAEEAIIDKDTGESRPAYAIIFITEDLAAGISKEDYKKLSREALPAIIPVPGSKGTEGYGIKRIGKMVEQAVGSDILKKD